MEAKQFSNKTILYYACCPYCKTVLVQAQNGLNGYIKCPKCDKYIHVSVCSIEIEKDAITLIASVLHFIKFAVIYNK